MSYINPISNPYTSANNVPVRRRPHGQAADANETYTLDAVQLSDDEESPTKQDTPKKRQQHKQDDATGEAVEPGGLDLTA